MTGYRESEKYKADVRKAVKKHNAEKMDTITVRVPKGLRREYNDAAEKAGMSFRQFFMEAMEEKMGLEEAKRNISNIVRSDIK